MSKRNMMLEQLAAVYDENNWFVCFNVAVQHLNDYEANEKEDDQANSVAELIFHLYFYNSRYLSRYCGEEVLSLPKNYNTFQSHDGMDWKETVKRMQRVYADFRHAIKSSSDEKIEIWCETLAHVWLHNAYHIGQIVHIRKRFGSWSNSPVVRG